MLGIFMLIITGFSWTIVGIILSNSAKTEDTAWSLLFLSTIFSVFIGITILFFNGAIFNFFNDINFKTIIFLSLAGIFNIIGLLIMQMSMKYGHNGIIWTIIQSAMVIPFIMGILFFNVQMKSTQLIGLILIIFTLIIFTLSQAEGKINNDNNKKEVKYTWLILSIAGFLIIGISQCFTTLPSYFENAKLNNVIKGTIFQIGSLSIFLIISIIKRKINFSKKIFKPAIIFSLVGVIPQFFIFFKGLDLITKAGYGSIGFPITTGSSILGFSLFSIFIIKEKISTLQYLGLLIGLAGIIFISY